jgi:hypothetical protein
VVLVTRQVQILVDEKSRLIFPSGQTKSQLIPGLYCPSSASDLEPKGLKIVYLFKSKLHSVTVGDLEKLIAPIKDHLVQSKNTPLLKEARYCDNSVFNSPVGTELVTSAKQDLSPSLRVKPHLRFVSWSLKLFTSVGIASVVWCSLFVKFKKL